MSTEALSVALAEVMENADWKVKLDGILEEKDIRVQEALDQREEVFRLETEKIRGMESHLETQVDKVRYLLDQVQQNLEEDRMATEKIQRQGTELSSALLEEETGRTELDGHIKELSGRALSAAELEKHFPDQKLRQSLFYKIVRIVFGKVKKDRPHAFRGYFSNVAGTDVTPFEFDTLKINDSRLAEILWDYVADGVSDQYKRIK